MSRAESWRRIRRCFVAQAPHLEVGEGRINALAIMLRQGFRGEHSRGPLHDEAVRESVLPGERPNLVLWNGRVHCPVLQLKDDYLPVNIRRAVQR